MCISMVVFHIMFDMGSSHKRFKGISPQIEPSSIKSVLLSAQMQTIGFGGLHYALRNHVLSNGNMNYGLNIFRGIKKSSLLQNIKQAVYVGRQTIRSPLLSDQLYFGPISTAGVETVSSEVSS